MSSTKALAHVESASTEVKRRRSKTRSEDLFRVAVGSLSANTRRAYEQDVRRFGKWWFEEAADMNRTLAQLITLSAGEAREVVLTYQASLTERQLSRNTIARAVRALNSIIKKLHFAEYVTWTLDIPVGKVEPYRDVRGPGEEAWTKLIEHAENDKRWIGYRDAAMLRLLGNDGLRASEVGALEYPLHFRRVPLPVFVKGKATHYMEAYIHGKGGKELWQPLHPKTWAAIESWLNVREQVVPNGTWLFFSERGNQVSGERVWDRVTSRARSAGLEHIHPHQLRHHAITVRAKAWTGTQVALSRWARHEDPRTTQLYIDEVGDSLREIAQMGDDD